MDSAEAHRPKRDLFEAIALMGKAFASPRRLELLDLLAQGPRSVEELARASDQSVASASQHLQALHAACLVSRERDGTRVRYELVARLQRGDAVLVDVRPRSEYDAGHIERARSIPLDELEQNMNELPKDREVVAYCRGPLCVMAHEAVRRLQAAGRSARRLEAGWPEWHRAQLEEIK